MTGSALVMTRLSRLAMNMGMLAATIASQTGMRRRAGVGTYSSTGFAVAVVLTGSPDLRAVAVG
jgi:hypothetical protein